MKKVSFKNLSVVGLVLMGASALTAAMIPSKATKAAGDEGNGRVVESSNGGGDTVVLTDEGTRSYTVTGQAGNPNDNLSATSADNALTNTNGGTGNNTGFGTTATLVDE
jgi:Ca2+-binding RTX toxin-like protein